LFGGNGGFLRFTISNPKYLGGPSGPSGSELPPLGSNGRLVEILFTSLSISSCKFTNYVPFGVCGLDLTPSTIWISVDTNKASIIVIID
jgi:hypothetical protein